MNFFILHTSYFLLHTCLLVVGLGGLEPPTSRLSVVCSSQLSYRPVRLPLFPPGGVGFRLRLVNVASATPPRLILAALPDEKIVTLTFVDQLTRQPLGR